MNYIYHVLMNLAFGSNSKKGGRGQQRHIEGTQSNLYTKDTTRLDFAVDSQQSLITLSLDFSSSSVLALPLPCIFPGWKV
jgi:hypothetical protein